MTPNQSWDEFVRSQSTLTFLDMKPDHLALEEYVQEYVKYLPNTVTDIDSKHFWSVVGADPITVSDLIIQHVESSL